MTTEVNDLISERTVLKRKNTQFTNHIKEIAQSELSESIINELQLRLKEAEHSFFDYQSIQKQIEIKLQSSEDKELLARQEKLGDEGFDAFISTISLANSLINQFLVRCGDAVANSPAALVSNSNGNAQVTNSNAHDSNSVEIDSAQVRTPSANSNSHSNSQQQQQQQQTQNGVHIIADIKLPSIQVPIFDGSYSNWLEFHDAFKSLIHDNNNLSQIQKFYYLKSALKAEASNVIHSISLSDNNYQIAWERLIARYENTNLIIKNHLQSLFDLPVVHKENASAIRFIIDESLKHIRNLEILREPVHHWDTILIHIICSKLDNDTNKEWDIKRNITNQVNFKEFIKFLENKCQILELNKKSTSSNRSQPYNQQSSRVPFKKQAYSSSTNQIYSCTLCKQPHGLYHCRKFLNQTPSQRLATVRNLKLCQICLRENHTTSNCKSSSCRKCSGRHNTLLHFNNALNQTTNSEEQPEPLIQSDPSVQPNINATTSQIPQENKSVLLSTAAVKVKDCNNKFIFCRALLDPGAEATFITQSVVSKLGIACNNISATVSGINTRCSKIFHKANILVSSSTSNYSFSTSALVLPKLTQKLPSVALDKTSFKFPSNFPLADPNFYKPQEIDIIFGADVFWDVLENEEYNLGIDFPRMQCTKLGWILGGKYSKQKVQGLSTYLSYNCTLTNLMEQFLNSEEFVTPNSPLLTKEEEECETYFNETTTRDNCGRFIVRIPLKPITTDLSMSKQTAEKRFFLLEKRFAKKPQLKEQYCAFMNEYLALGHMSKICDSVSNKHFTYYLPHHPVFRPSSSTTKIRVVFDGSAKTELGFSVNDFQKVGPVVQNDLYSILLRFRTYNFVLCADIEKMYRQILVNKSDRSLQRIVWRENPTECLNTYELNTVTYGTSSAPYLATRCLQQLALENKPFFPLESSVIANDFYVDDLITGHNSLQQLINIKSNLKTILKQAGFSLRKWLSNDTELMENSEIQNQLVKMYDSESKILGICWNQSSDNLQYSIQSLNNFVASKRTILSETAKIYDPLGLLSPIIIRAKLIIQSLWQLKIGWDEDVPETILKDWNILKNQLGSLNNVEISRHVLIKHAVKVEIHAFSDASERAYGVSVYLKSVNSDGQCQCNLLTSKSKVAPLKQISLPRLELCAAVLSAKLVNKIQTQIKVDRAYFWTDSTIVLSWLAKPSNHWKTFVANRVATIARLTDFNNWQHVRSADNPADIVSRGLTPNEIIKNNLWWYGPCWLKNNPTEWPTQQIITSVEIETRPNKILNLHASTRASESFDLFKKISSFTKLIKVFSYCLRFINNLRSQANKRLQGNLSTQEIADATLILIKIAQNQSFPEEIKYLQAGKYLPNNSKLLPLSVYIADDGLIRVGGRLKNSKLPNTTKHQILLNPNHPLSILIAKHEHQKLLHCGPQALLHSLRTRYWIVHGRRFARTITQKCIICFKTNPKSAEQLMGNLPNERVNHSPPFFTTGTDFAGPIFIKDRQGRGCKTSKSYICEFICFATKAIHIELVTDLSTDAFIAALRRFASRRGTPRTIYSDNGKNYVGANNQLAELGSFLKEHSNSISDRAVCDNVNWKFIPPNSPHFGGLWEAGIKSIKTHLKRIVGNNVLTFEGMYTVLVQIEAALNSRPLSPMSEDPNDMMPLTPAHFLIGRQISLPPDADVTSIKENRLSQYQRYQSLLQHFWQRWSHEYLHELQMKHKWNDPNKITKIQPGDLVLIKDNNLPPLKWKLGRIIQLHTGSDGQVRVVTVKSGDSDQIKRPITKVCPLPLETCEAN